jgi:hypothetical protein
MSPRDPADLARIAPEALPLVEAIDALYALLEACEEESVRWLDPPDCPLCRRVLETQRHARAMWDRLVSRDGEQERAANAKIDAFMGIDGTEAEIRGKGGWRR